ncbi:hypothetical protein ACMDB5_04150 [Flavobacterium sp. W1B]|uniref:hypothetical protein n=1 Tax=Flavobacterium sp. W1B TaxID=3394146 RepID=UPI0039BC2CE9
MVILGKNIKTTLSGKILASIAFLLLVLVIACDSKKESKANSVFYEAVNNRDTALLSIVTNGFSFNGNYEIIYGNKAIKDSGDVSGKIKGDTLIGTYNYKSYGGSWKRLPIAFLKKENKLILGNGVEGGYMGFVYFNPEVPLDFNSPKFIFEKTKDSLIKN